MDSKSEKVSDGLKNYKCQKALYSELDMSNGLEIKKQVPKGFKIKDESVNGVKIKEGGGWLQNQRWKCRKALQSKMNRKASINKSKCRMASELKMGEPDGSTSYNSNGKQCDCKWDHCKTPKRARCDQE